MQELFAFVEDELLPLSRASLSIRDLAIQRGYGIFDFFKILDGRAIFLEEHLDRFFTSAARMRLDAGLNRAALVGKIAELQRVNGLVNSGMRLTLTGGLSPDGFTLSAPVLVIHQIPLPVVPGPELFAAIRLVSYPHRRQLPEIKTIDYMMAIWLQPYIRSKGADDVLYVSDGLITECPRSSFFMVSGDGVLVTPGRDILRGVIRGKLLELARRKWTVEERDIRLEELASAREAFITSTTKHVLPVMQVDEMVIGSGKAGPVAQWLCEQLYLLVNR